MSAIVQQLRCACADVVELALPRSCPACGTFVDGGASLMCEMCETRLDEARRAPACARCASPLPDAAGPCGRCRGKGIPPFDAIARLGTYESTLRSLIHAIKYGRRWPLVPLFAEQMATLPHIVHILDDADVLVPVPLHWSRRIARGFNQSQLLAHALGRSRSIAVVKAVRRVRRTPSQVSRSRAARRRNMIGAFRVTQPTLLSGRRVVLIDDVMTTGATLLSMARTIKNATRPTSISVIVIATGNPLTSDLTAI